MANDLTQRLVLVLQKKGMESFDEVKARLKELEGQYISAGEALADAFAKGEGEILAHNDKVAKLVKEYSELQKLLDGMKRAVQEEAEAEGKAQRERIDGWARALSDIDAYEKRLKQMAIAEVAAAENGAMEEHLRDVAALQERLGAMERQNASQRQDDAQKTTAALQAGNAAIQSRMAQIKAQEQAEGDALRAKIELYARLERMGQAQLEEERNAARESLLAQKEAAGQTIRARAEMHARIEAMAEQANAEAKRQLGDSIRAAAERHARIEEMEEEAKRKRIATMTAEFAAAESLRNQKMLYEMAANKKLNDAQIKQLDSLSSSIQGVNKFSDVSLESFAKLGQGMTQQEQKSKNFAMGLMAVAHAAQDAQYGFGAVVNNIPQIAYAMGNAMPGMEKFATQFAAVAMIGGTLVNIALPYIKQFATSFAREVGLMTDPLRTAAVTTDQMKAKLEALTSKTWKVDVDYSMIQMAEKRLALLEERQKAWESMSKARSSIEEESGKRASEAITGQGNMDGLVRAMTDSMGKMGLLKMDTEAQRNLRSAEAEMEQLRKTMNDPNTSPFAYLNASGRNLVLETQLPGMKDAVRREIDKIVKDELGAAGRGEKQKVSDVLAAVNANPESFRAQGIDPMKLAAGLMGAEHQTIKDQRDSEKFAAEQAKDAKRRKDLDAAQTDRLNEAGKAAEAAMKPELDAFNRRREMQAKAFQEANDRQMEAAEKHARDAPKVEARNQAAQARQARSIQAQMKRNQADQNRLDRIDDQRKAQVEQVSLAAELEAAGLSQGFARQGSKLAQQAMKRGVPEKEALEQAFDRMVRIAAKQEQQMGMMGRATDVMLQLDRKQQAMDMQMQRVQQQLGLVGAKRRTILLPPGQGQ